MHEDNIHTGHLHSDRSRGQNLLYVALLNISITIVQTIGGLISNSLSLLSDALHNLGDSSAIFIAYVAGKISTKKPDAQKTFGYKRAEILAALFNAIVLIVICIFLLFEAWKRFSNPEPIKGKLMFVVATFGLLANLFSVFILKRDKAHNLNVKAAYVHLMGDTLSSVAVIAGGIIIWLFKVYWIDPVITILVGIYIFWHAWSIVKQTVDILMQAVPPEIDLDEIKKQVEAVPGIDNIHHVHAWKLDDTQTHIEAHLNLGSNMDIVNATIIREKVEQLLQKQFGFRHITLQLEYNCCQGEGESELIKGTSESKKKTKPDI